MENQESMIDKLNKLIAHERSARAIGSIEEAETFAAKIQTLMFAHKLEMSDLEYAAEEANEPVDSELVSEYDLTGARRDTNRSQSWVGVLVNAVAIANFCRVVGSRVGNGCTIIGKPSDRATTKTLFKYLYDTCLEAAPEHARTRCEFGTKQEKSNFTKGFKFGFSTAIAKRLMVEKTKLKASAQEQGLIRIDQLEKAVDAKTHEVFPRLQQSRPTTRNYAGYVAGKEYGSAVGINSAKRLSA